MADSIHKLTADDLTQARQVLTTIVNDYDNIDRNEREKARIGRDAIENIIIDRQEALEREALKYAFTTVGVLVYDAETDTLGPA